MNKRTTKSLLRSVALVGAVAASATAFGARTWTGPAEGAWEEANWTITDNDDSHAILDNSGGVDAFTIVFSAPETYDGYIWNLANVTFKADDAQEGEGASNSGYGLTVGDVRCGTWGWGGIGINSGTYNFSRFGIAEGWEDLELEYPVRGWIDVWGGTLNVTGDSVAGGGANGTIGYFQVAGGTANLSGKLTLGTQPGSTGVVTVNSGTLNATSIEKGVGEGVGEIYLNDGTLKATNIGEGLTLNVAGGTFQADTDATIAATLIGTGTLTKTGEGKLTISGDVSYFIGTIVVAEGAGSVTVGEEVIEAGSSKTFERIVPTYTTWSEDFETDASLDGWASSYVRLSKERSSRTLADGTTSYFSKLKITHGGNGTNVGGDWTYALDFKDAEIYSFEFDYFPKVSYNNENTLKVYGKRTVDGAEQTVTLATFTTVNSDGRDDNVRVYAEGAVDTKLPIDGRGASPDTSAETSKRWYRVIVSAGYGKTYLSVLDRSGNVVLEETEIGDFAKISSLVQTLKSSGADHKTGLAGFDNFVYKTVAPEGIPAEPAFDMTPSYAGDREVTLTCEDENATIYYREGSTGEFVPYAEPITVTETTTIYAYAENEAGHSYTVSQVVYAHVKLNAPSLARRGWYRMQVTPGANPETGVAPIYTYKYQFPGESEKSVEEQNPIVGVGSTKDTTFDDDGSAFWTSATAEGYIDSDKTSYTSYSFSSDDYALIYNKDFVGYKYTTVWHADTMESNGTTYKAFKENNTNKTFHDPVWFSDIDRGGYPRWVISSGNGLYLNNMDGTILFKGMKLGSLVYVNADAGKHWNPVNLTKLDEYTNTEEEVYVVDGTPDETGLVDATLSFTKNTYIYCIKVYQPYDKVAQVGETKYNTLAAAVEAANGETITLLADCDGFTLAADQSVTINFNGFESGTIAVPEGYVLQFKEAGDNTYTYWCEVEPEPQGGLEPGEVEEVATEEEAEAVVIGVPEAVSSALSDEQVTAYKACFEKVVTPVDGGFQVAFVLTEDTEESLQEAVDGVFEGEGENVVDLSALAASEEATSVTVSAIPGFYYGVSYGASLEGGAVWTTDATMATGDTVEITFPAASESGSQFFQVIASPVDPNGATVEPGENVPAGDGNDQA